MKMGVEHIFFKSCLIYHICQEFAVSAVFLYDSVCVISSFALKSPVRITSPVLVGLMWDFMALHPFSVSLGLEFSWLP